MKAYVWDAGDYERHSSAQQAWARELIAKLALKGDECLLDIGCGDGKVTAELARRLLAGYVVGIDSAASMVRLARARQAAEEIPNLSFCLADALDLPFCASFDIAFSNATLHWVHDHHRVLQRVPEPLRERFVADLAASYLALHPLDEAGLAHVAMVRLEVEAVKWV
jgi:trans-aconitate 2-methyltransferase